MIWYLFDTIPAGRPGPGDRRQQCFDLAPHAQQTPSHSAG